MEAARAWGVPHSILTGRAHQPGTPAWTAQDTALAVALAGVEALQCGGCGHDRRESMNPDLEDDWLAEPVRCHACAARDRAAHAFTKDGDPAGLRFTVTRKDDRR